MQELICISNIACFLNSQGAVQRENYHVKIANVYHVLWTDDSSSQLVLQREGTNSWATSNANKMASLHAGLHRSALHRSTYNCMIYLVTWRMVNILRGK
jgi:hypothetical protein